MGKLLVVGEIETHKQPDAFFGVGFLFGGLGLLGFLLFG